MERSKIIQERFGDHPFETGLREKVRGFIEAMIRSELDAVLARPRYARQRTGAPEVDPPTSARLP